MPAFRFVLFPWFCVNARGLGACWVCRSPSLNPFSKACATLPTKRNLFTQYLWKEERNILGTERQVIYSVTYKPSVIPGLWWGENVFTFSFFNYFKNFLFWLFVSGITLLFSWGVSLPSEVWFVWFFYFCKLVVSSIQHILKQHWKYIKIFGVSNKFFL